MMNCKFFVDMKKTDARLVDQYRVFKNRWKSMNYV